MEKKELRKITRAELNVILDNHNLWLDTAENEGERADLSYTDLQGFNLAGANLHLANLRGADLSGANLSCANLVGTNLRGADLTEANLQNACLLWTDLVYTNLYLANLRGADLTEANLQNACLLWTDLVYTNLYLANLRGADLTEANLQNATLTDVKNFPDIPMACPTEGSFIGWKRAGDYIVKLEIPADAKRSSGTGIKCRCNKAKVLSIETKGGTPADVTEVHSVFDSNFIYRVGETVTVNNFDDNRFNECAPGIHFYMDRKRAVPVVI